MVLNKTGDMPALVQAKGFADDRPPGQVVSQGRASLFQNDVKPEPARPAAYSGLPVLRFWNSLTGIPQLLDVAMQQKGRRDVDHMLFMYEGSGPR
jgi:hypothetical protein